MVGKVNCSIAGLRLLPREAIRLRCIGVAISAFRSAKLGRRFAIGTIFAFAGQAFILILADGAGLASHSRRLRHLLEERTRNASRAFAGILSRLILMLPSNTVLARHRGRLRPRLEELACRARAALAIGIAFYSSLVLAELTQGARCLSRLVRELPQGTVLARHSCRLSHILEEPASDTRRAFAAESTCLIHKLASNAVLARHRTSR